MGGVLTPNYNIFIYFKIIGKPWWGIFLFFTPFVNLIFHIWGCYLLAKKFGKGLGFAVGIVLLPFIFLPILGFGFAQYDPYGDGIKKFIKQGKRLEKLTNTIKKIED